MSKLKYQALLELINELKKAKEEGDYTESLIDDLYSYFNLDITFTPSEIKKLRKNKFRISRHKMSANKVISGNKVSVEKFDYLDYEVRVGNKRTPANTLGINDLDESITSSYILGWFGTFDKKRKKRG